MFNKLFHAAALIVIAILLSSNSYFSWGTSQRAAAQNNRLPGLELVSLNDVNMTYNVERSNITINKGQEFTVTISSNPGVGDSWLPVFDKHSIELVSEQQTLKNPWPGSPGDIIFTFTPKQSGTISIIKFDNHFRGGSKPSAEKILSVKVR